MILEKIDKRDYIVYSTVDQIMLHKYISNIVNKIQIKRNLITIGLLY